MDDRKIGLTIFLLRVDRVSDFEQKLIELDQVDKNRQTVPLNPPLDGLFLSFPTLDSNVPSWVRSVESLLTDSISGDMTTKSPGGLLVVRRAGRTFVVSFGHAWQKLEDRWLERDFGLRVALNAIPKNDVIGITAEQVFAKWHLANERAPRASSVEEFGVDFDRDLVAAVEGIPKSCPKLGSRVRGSTSLRVKLPLSGLESILDLALKEYRSNRFKKDWPDIDKINPVRDDLLINLLEQQVDNALSSPQTRRRISMFTPSQRRGETILAESYVYGQMRSPVSTPYLTVEGWVSTLARRGISPSVGEAKKSPVHLLDDAEKEIHSCMAFDCFGYEFSDGNQVYVLSSGEWYEVVSDFIGRINRTLTKIKKPKTTLQTWNQSDDEGQYNAKCSAATKLLNCDAKNVFYGGGSSQFEFCDLLDLNSKTLYFAKIVSKSSGMSHLTEQVRRTAQLFFGTDNEYRRKVASKLAQHFPKVDLTSLKDRPRPGDWSLCMVSLGRSAAQLPFFAKCGLAKVFKDLSEQGHTIQFTSV